MTDVTDKMVEAAKVSLSNIRYGLTDAELERALTAALSVRPAQEPVAEIEFARGVAGRENEMPRVVSCNWLPDGIYSVYAVPQPAFSQPNVKVKPLEWVEHGDLDFVWHRAMPPIGPRYNIEDDGFSEKKHHLTAGQLVIGNFDTLDEAKSAAQSDYDIRVRAALYAAPQPALSDRGEDSTPSPVDSLAIVTQEMIEAVAWSPSSQPGMPYGMILSDDDIRNILTIGTLNGPVPPREDVELPLSAPLHRETDETWKQVIGLFRKHGLPEPPVRLRDELVVALEWAWYGYEGAKS